jgi:hypothetical protein
MNSPDHISESLETIFWVTKLFDSDPDPGSEIFLTMDPGWKHCFKQTFARTFSTCPLQFPGREVNFSQIVSNTF